MRSTPSIDTANPLLDDWPACGAPPFDRIRAHHVLPALDIAMADHEAELQAVRDNPAPPDFDNSIVALERSGERLARVRRLFFALSSAEAGPGIRAIEGEVSQRLAAHGAAISHDTRLFTRVQALWERRGESRLSGEQLRLLEQSWRGFVHGGALLDDAGKQRFAEIEQQLAALSVRFGQNVLAATAAFRLTVDADALGGLPDSLIAAAAARADADGAPGRYAFGLDRGEVEDVLALSTHRPLREALWRGFVGRCDGGEHDNNPLIGKILTLRQERATLLGYRDHASFALADSMAGSAEGARTLLERIWEPAKRQANREAEALQALIDAEDGGHALAPWDWRHFAERRRSRLFAVDAAAIKAHLTLDAVRDAAFDVARQLYGLDFQRRPDLPVYHPDVDVWAVGDRDGTPLGLLYTDYLARPTKHSGAWMGSLRVQERIDEEVRPVVYAVANAARPAEGHPACLSLGEARTLFHEFGHALHALLSSVTYPSLAGTAVPRDFVELPSKLMERWAISAPILERLGLPAPLAAAIGRAECADQGFATVELAAAALVDLDLHSRRDFTGFDPRAYEREMLDRLDMPAAIGLRHRLPHFTHIFDGGYSASYYGYLWSEVLDADAFAAFRESGDIFNPDLARRFRDEILAPGDSRPAMDSWLAFRGRAPDATALLVDRQLIDA